MTTLIEIKQITEGENYYLCTSCFDELKTGLDKIIIIDTINTETILCEKCAKTILIGLDKLLDEREEK